MSSFFLKIFPFCSLLYYFPPSTRPQNLPCCEHNAVSKVYRDCHVLWSQDPPPALFHMQITRKRIRPDSRATPALLLTSIVLTVFVFRAPIKPRGLERLSPFPFFLFHLQPRNLPAKLSGPRVLQGPPSLSGSRGFPHQSFSLVDGHYTSFFSHSRELL